MSCRVQVTNKSKSLAEKLKGKRIIRVRYLNSSLILSFEDGTKVTIRASDRDEIQRLARVLILTKGGID